MSYGKNSTKKKANKKATSQSNRKNKFGITFGKSIFIGIGGVVLLLIILFGVYSAILIARCPDITTIDVSPTGYMSKVYDQDGNQIETLAESGANREYVTLNDIPENVQHAFIAIEDSRFYDHNGIDTRGIVRAAFTSIISLGQSSQGASTLTQQLLKNNYFTQWMSETSFIDRLNRKIKEQYLAVELERVMDKNTILENYLNTINLGHNTLGVEAASEKYFNKRVSDLNLAEAAVIAAITQNPSKYNPILHPDNNKARQQKVLEYMYDQDFITKDELNNALEDNVYERIETINSANGNNSSTSYFIDALTEQLIDDLMDKNGYTEAEASKLIYSGGLKIYSTQISSIQQACEEEINNQKNYPSAPKTSISFRLTVKKADGSTKNYSEQTMLSYYQSKNPGYVIDFNSEEEARAAYEKYKSEIMQPGDTIPGAGESISYTLQPQAAMTIMDHTTGAVVALVGGRGEKKGSLTLNRATDITRQPGSTFKIVTAYAPALDAGGLTLASVQDDCPTSYSDGNPLNNYDFSFRGFTTLREGITDSINIVTVKTIAQIGTGLGFEYAKNLGITTLVSGDNNQALALGGITNGVTNLELTGAYAAIANGGKYNKPFFYTKVEDAQGNVLIDNSEKKRKSKQVLKETTAWLLTSAMQDVMTKGTGTPANFEGQVVAGKSGTTTKNRDTLFAGYTPYYTCVIWGGNDDNAVQGNTSYSKAIWKAVMSRIHFGLARKEFPMPAGITTASVCRKSGKLAVPGLCDEDPRGSMVYEEYFAEGSVPSEVCDHHVRVNICTESNQISTEYCPSTSSAVYIIGGSEGSADGPYLYDINGLTNFCQIHSSAPVTTVTTTTTTTTKDKTSDNTSTNGNTDSNKNNGENNSQNQGSTPSNNPSTEGSTP